MKKWSNETRYRQELQNEYAKQSTYDLYDKRFLRAILVFLPVDNFDRFFPEFKWFYRSWIEMQKNEPYKWRTDILLFMQYDLDYIDTLAELNCTINNRRTSEFELPMCSLFKYTPLKYRNLTLLKNPIFFIESPNATLDIRNLDNLDEKYDYLLKKIDIFSDDQTNLLPFLTLLKESFSDYIYLDSIIIAFEGYKYFKSGGYDFIIRSDLDVFLTPLFGKWLPRHCNDFVVGGGDYSDTLNVSRLKRVSNYLNFKSAGIKDLGSTWISTPEQFRLVAYLSLFGMIYLYNEEFTKPEKLGQIGGLWPEWHADVVLLYGQYLALNHLIATNQLNVPKLDDFIDYPSYLDATINDKLHIHVYHNDEIFSKFKFIEGAYNNMSIPRLEIDQIKLYCLKLALESKRFSHRKLLRKFQKQSIKKI